MIRDFTVMRHSLKDPDTGKYTEYFHVSLYYANVSDDPWSRFDHYLLFPTYELAESFLNYIRVAHKPLDWRYWILRDADSPAEPCNQTAEVETEVISLSY
ncbi:hypothetical protein JD793_002714 [Citrobacter braakii]|nr:hypothetical protein [Citrobacter braakii]